MKKHYGWFIKKYLGWIIYWLLLLVLIFVYFSVAKSDINLSEGQLFYFSIDSSEYQGEYGMTWEDWLDSNYNSNSRYFSSPGREYFAKIYTKLGYRQWGIVRYLDDNVHLDDKIIPDRNYGLDKGCWFPYD